MCGNRCYCLLARKKYIAAELTIEEASQLALKDDYTLQAIAARSESLSERAVATGRLPDPKLKLGFANLPTDSFNLGQEPMTQAVIGVQQMFPRGQTRSLNSERLNESVARNEAEALDRQLLILLAVREEYTKIFLHRERQKILQQSLGVFTDLAEITRDYFATGRAHQQDVVQSQLELSRVQERLIGMQQQEEQARARLAEKIGADAFRELDTNWPQIGQPQPAEQIIASLAEHPRMTRLATRDRQITEHPRKSPGRLTNPVLPWISPTVAEAVRTPMVAIAVIFYRSL